MSMRALNIHFNYFLKHNYATLINGSVNKNDSFIKIKSKSDEIIEQYHKIRNKFADGGDERSRLRHISLKKLLVPDRLNILFDNQQYLELCYFVGYGQSYGDIPKGGGTMAFGRINNRLCAVAASEPTVKGGAVFPIYIQKQLRILELSLNLHIPLIFIVDSAGAFLPLQAEIFPDKNHGGRIFYYQAVLQSKGIPVIALACGSCVAGAAYMPTMCSENGMVHKTSHIFLGAPLLVKAATGEIVLIEELGGAAMHNKVSGCSDHIFQNEKEGLLSIRDIIATLPKHYMDSRNIESSIESLYSSKDLNGIVLNFENNNENSRIMIMQILARILDGSVIQYYKNEFGTNVITGFGRISGYSIGIVACHGCLSERDCLKSSNFIQICGHRNIPIISLIHTVDESRNNNVDNLKDFDGSMVKAKSLMMRSMATRNTKLIAVVIGDAVGMDYICLGGRSMEPDFLIAWTNARFGWTENDLEDVKGSSAMIAAGNMVVDEIIKPCNTRLMLTRFLEILHVKTNLLPEAHAQPVYRF